MTRPTAPEGASVALELRGYRVRKHGLDMELDVDFPAGVNVVLGVNGVGKTTVLRSLVEPSWRAKTMNPRSPWTLSHVRGSPATSDLWLDRAPSS